jgi:3-deoxy-manno-octulosonate cytidylyltransferase (CMP-KDO synthetase)
MPDVIAIIPARYASTRFPGKPLVLINDYPMFWHVCTRAARCPLITRVVLATDDERIRAKAEELNVPVLMTSPDHPSGTDRVLEAARQLGVAADAVVVNVQGDEPALDPAMLTELIEPFADPAVQVATLGHEISAEEAASPDKVKIARAASGRALYFSRSPIPFGRDTTPRYIGHIGLYAFRFAVLEKFSALGESPLERLEKLEQLRLLEADIPIHVVITARQSHGVDRPEDLPTIRELMRGEHI